MLDLLPDLCDDFPDKVSVCPTQFLSFGTKRIFYGEVVTVKCFEDNSIVKEQVNLPGENRVLVVDGGGSMRRALLGDMLAEAAMKNGWAGILIYGCLRDAGTINSFDIGVKALGTHPVKTDKRGLGDLNVEINFSGVTVKPGDFAYADENGILFASENLIN